MDGWVAVRTSERKRIGERMSWLQVTSTELRTAWAWAPIQVRLSPQTLRFTTAGRIACSARKLVASTLGCRWNVNHSLKWFRKCFANRA